MTNKMPIYGLLFFVFTNQSALGEKGLSINGCLQSDLDARIRDSVRYRGSEFRLDLKAEVKPTDKTSFFAEFWLRTLGQPQANRLSELANQRAELNLREAYLDLYGTPFAKCDLRLGRQRIAWGTADKLNPTDNLNPPDLEDIWDFGRRLGTNAVKISMYPGSYTITGAIIPFFEPAVLPHDDWAGIFAPDIGLPPGMCLRRFTDSLLLPGNDLGQNMIAGIKASRTALGYNLSLSYVRGRDFLPLPRRLALVPADTMGGIDIRSELVFPRHHVFGADLAGSIAGLGVWLEAAAFLPDEAAVLTTDLTGLGLGKVDSVILPKKPYFKYVLGIDYTFSNSIYANLQFLHGFIHERGAAGLEDYFLTGLEWKLFDERLKIMPLSGGVEVKDFADLTNNYAFIYAPEISYRPADNAELIVGAHWIDGNKATTFGRSRGLSEIFLRLSYSF